MPVSTIKSPLTAVSPFDLKRRVESLNPLVNVLLEFADL